MEVGGRTETKMETVVTFAVGMAFGAVIAVIGIVVGYHCASY